MARRTRRNAPRPARGRAGATAASRGRVQRGRAAPLPRTPRGRRRRRDLFATEPRDVVGSIRSGRDKLASLRQMSFRYRWQLLPVVVALGVYVAGAVAHSLGAGLAVAAVLLGAAGANLAAHKHFPRVSERIYVGVLSAVIGVWLILAALIGPDRRPLPGVWLVASLGLAVPWWSHRRVRSHIQADRSQEAWPALAEACGIAGVKLRRYRATPLGWDGVLYLVPGVMTWKNVVDAVPRIEAYLGTRHGAVRVRRDPDNAGRVPITVVHEDVFKARGDLEHPALSDDPAWEPGSATVTEPIPVGLTETGTQATLVVFDDTGARHTLIGGMKGSGKSGFESDMIAGLARCRDVVIWAIDVQKGAQFATHWGVGDGGCIDRVATSRAQATRMFAAAREIIRDRATERANDPHATSDKHIPTPDRPALAIIVDEAADLLNVGDVDAVESARSTTTSGRSEAVSVTLATQRPTVPSVGDGDLKAQLDNAVGLKMRKSSDVRFVFPDDAESFDTSLFRRPGMCFIGDGEAAPIPARTWALYRPPVVRRIAAKLAPGRPKLDAHAEAIAAKWLDGPTAPPLHSATTGASDQVDTGNNRRPGKPDVDQLRAKLQQQEAAAIEAAETDPPLPETPMSELARPAEVPEDLVDQAAAVLAELSAAGIKSDDTNARILARVRAAGTGRVQTRDLVAAAGLHRSRVQDRINALVAAGLIRAAGRGHWTAVPAAPTDEAAAQ